MIIESTIQWPLGNLPFPNGHDLLIITSDILLEKPNRFENLSPFRAAITLLIFFAVVGYGVFISQSSDTSIPVEDKKGGDFKCYQAIVENIRAGQDYYTAAGHELRTRGYATGSTFNWRLPVLAWTMGHLPNDQLAHLFAIILASSTLLIWMNFLSKEYPFNRVLMGSLLLISPIIISIIGDIYFAHEFWAGTLILFSVGAYAKGWHILSVVAGLLGLYIRELTLPFVLVMAGLSFYEKRHSEALTWMIGITGYFILFYFHRSILSGLITKSDFVQSKGWLAFGGWSFVLSTFQMYPYLLLAPKWLSAITLPCAILGLIGWRGTLGTRITLTVSIYICSYLFIGLPYNEYWGLMYTNLAIVGLINTPGSIASLWRSTFKAYYTKSKSG